ncbi:transcription factor [Ahniella affigens]|uniref:Transcription factor n=1 Tax=Ahniella affigens TaxID=2021234 RepID=A0A2P1PYX5_9GAMM|nr:transcription factor [Ahniella affigens]
MTKALPIEVRASRGHLLGMPVAQFLKHYWQKHPLLIREAFPDFESPVSPNDLAGLALEPLALARIVTHDRKKDQWKLESGPFPEKRFARTGKKDWTLLVQDVDKWDPDIAALLEHFRFLPRWRIDDIMISYAVAGGSVGAHVDQYDVFLLQGMGHRRWQIDVDPNCPRDFRDDVELKLLKEFWPTHDWVLGPGDMLYLPPNVPHHGVAEDECLTISVGMRAPAIHEMLGDLADSFAEKLSEDQRLVDPDLRAANDPYDIDAAAIKRVRHSLAPLLALDDAALGNWFASFITRYRAAQEPAAPPRPLSLTQLGDRLNKQHLLTLHPYARMARLNRGRNAQVVIAGQTIDTDAEVYALLRERAVRGADWTRLNQVQRDLLHHLYRQGLMVLARDQR